jgi:hypothetical protein
MVSSQDVSGVSKRHLIVGGPERGRRLRASSGTI